MIIPVEELVGILNTHKINIKGIIHIGAHLCEEKQLYNNILKVDDANIVWVDAIEEITNINKCRGIPNCYTAVLDEVERDAVFKITNNNTDEKFNLMSSSLLDFGTHATDHPNVVVSGTRTVRTESLQQFVDKHNIHISKFNFWNLDIQGSELHVLRGSKNLLKYADCIYTEVNTKEVYKGCGKMDELDTLLLEKGFIRVYTNVYESLGWGDALYVRNNIELNIFNNCDSKKNGEYAFYNRIKSNIKVIFDVGCRVDSEFLEFEEEVHYFDPVPQFIDALSKTSRNNKKAFFNNFGLSDEDKGLFYFPNYQSFYDRVSSCGASDENNKVILPLKTGKDYVLKNNISKIDFLKIDTEGFELHVLKGFGDALSIVNIIQFEYGGTYLDNNTKMIDVINYLKEHNFHKFSYLTENGTVAITDFNDHYKYCNIVCVNKMSDYTPF